MKISQLLLLVTIAMAIDSCRGKKGKEKENSRCPTASDLDADTDPDGTDPPRTKACGKQQTLHTGNKKAVLYIIYIQGNSARSNQSINQLIDHPTL